MIIVIILSLLLYILQCHSLSDSKNNVVISNFFFVGPFSIGKTEIDIDPLEQYTYINSNNGSICNRLEIIRKYDGCPTKFISELSDTGYVGFNKLHPIVNNDGIYNIIIQFPIKPNALVNFQSLHTTLSNKASILEFSGWVIAKFNIKKNGIYLINCGSIHTYYIDNIIYTGDIYSTNDVGNLIELYKGKHNLDIRIRAKLNLQFQCSIKYYQSNNQQYEMKLASVRRNDEITDILDGLNLKFLSLY
jgi:hypothetical protein